MSGQCPVCARVVETTMDGREVITHCTFAGPLDGKCAGSGRVPSRATPPAPAWAVAMEERIMTRLADLARGYRLPPPARAPGGDAGREDDDGGGSEGQPPNSRLWP